jgi:enoyl-CoA hydratase/carnithine racemase
MTSTADSTASTPEARRDEADGVLTITFTRDRKLNAVTPFMLDMLREAVKDMTEREDLRVLVITGEGRYFTAGIDIGTLNPDPGRTADGDVSGIKVRAFLRKLHIFIDSLESLEKPVVLAAQGPCLGLGLEMGVSCDFRLASERATFSLPEIPKMGVIAGSGGISRLTRLVGPHWARWLGMLSRSIDARKAEQIGLVHEIYPDEEFAERVQQFARELVALPGEALALAKLAIDAAASADRTTARDFDRVANTLLLLSEQNRSTVSEYSKKSK